MNKLTCKIALIVIVLSMALTACGTGNYSLTSSDQGNMTNICHGMAVAANAGHFC